MQTIRMYTTPWCPDCHRAKEFLAERGIVYEEINVDQIAEAEALVLRVNGGLRKVPTVELEDRYFACSPFDPERFAAELRILLNR